MTAPRLSVVLPVLAPTPFLRNMTEFAIKTLRINADDPTFELIVCEAEHDYFAPYGHEGLRETNNVPSWVDKYLNFNPKIGGVKEINAGIDAASCEYILLAGTDIIAPNGWDTELLRLFADRKDCGAATLSAYEPNATIGPTGPLDLVVEGMFSPFTMIRKPWRYDESYERVYQDSDMILRMYEAGLRSYRSCRKHVWHLGSVTNNGASQEHIDAHAKALARDERLFYKRWGRSPLAAFAMMRGGAQVYGREHEALVCNINLHYDPNKEED